MAFKMKGSPMQRNYGIESPMKADNLFQRIGKQIFGKEARQKRVDKQLESKKGTEYEGMTSMQAARAEKKSRKPGESKFQADSRKMGEKKRADKKASKAAAASSIKGEDFGNKNREKRTTSIPKGDGVAINIKETPDETETKLTFKQAFAAARKAGKKKFTWKGNPYTTELA